MAGMPKSYDFCYDPPAVAGNKGGSGCNSSSPCAAGEGDCDNDSDCDAGLECFLRIGTEWVPGVGSISGMPSGYGVCYAVPPCEQHTGITGPEYPGLKLPDGTDASPTWYVPYQEHELRADLRARDCNPASCDNPSACGIPVCRGINGAGGDADMRAYWTGIFRSSCKGAGCDIEKYAQVVASTFPDDRNVQGVIDSTVDHSGQSSPMTATDAFPKLFLPGIRFGVYTAPEYSPGFVLTTPYSTDYRAGEDADGSWLRPDRRFCNPLGWLSSSKMAIAHSGVVNDKKSGVIITKLAICLKANCAADDAACAPTKCYVSKKGKCVTFDEDVFHNYAEKHAREHSIKAYELFKSGEYKLGCNKAAEDSSRSAVAAN